MNHETLRLQVDGGIARLTLCRPDRLNAFNEQLQRELRDALSQATAAQARVLVLTGAGKAFCAGQDLSEREAVARGEPIDLGDTIERNFKPLVLALQAAPFATIARVNGVAAGAGSSVALACDLVVAARSASFIQSFVKIGLAPDAGGSWQLVRRVGMARALGLALLGERLSAEQAAACGLIWQCVDDADLDRCVDETAAALAALPAGALASIRILLQQATSHSLAQQLDAERDVQRALGYSTDYREGVTAFLAKRTPRFGGRQG